VKIIRYGCAIEVGKLTDSRPQPTTEFDDQWPGAVKTDRLKMPRLPMLLRLAAALGVDDLAELTGDDPMPIARLTHADNPAVHAYSGRPSAAAGTPWRARQARRLLETTRRPT
jgi:hypothetical protein